MTDINLFENRKFKEDNGSWFPFSENPEYKGFEIKIKCLTPKEWNVLRKRCTSIKRGKEVYDDQKFQKLTSDEVIIDFRGLTVGMLKRLVPSLEGVEGPDGKLLNDDAPINYSSDNAHFIRINSNSVITFINDITSDEDDFYYKRKEDEGKNSLTSVSGSNSSEAD